MPNQERITPAENRNFPTTLGDWTSDGEWQADPQHPNEGMMVFSFAAAGEPQHASLAYPNIAPVPGQTNEFRFAIGRLTEGTAGPCDWLITDGNYSFSGSGICDLNFLREPVQANIDLPADWNKNATSLQLTLHGNPTAPNSYMVKAFTLINEAPPPQIDYLPIMGIG